MSKYHGPDYFNSLREAEIEINPFSERLIESEMQVNLKNIV